MATSTLEADYVVIGAGAMGMAFVDTMLTETDHDIIMIDAHDKPGGHWNDAYPYVTLHQPSAYYGVSSKELSKGHIDQTGLNKGLEDLATGPEILSYFDDVMRRRFLTSERVQYFPMHEYDWEGGEAHAKLNDNSIKLKARKKLVDATWLKTSVPSTHEPNFEVEEGVNFNPLNDLPKIAHGFDEFVVCGGGKTAMDAVLWLLENGCPSDNIRWIMPRDGWLMNRANTQTQDQFFHATMGNQANQMEAIANSTSIENLFQRLEDEGCLVRLDTNVQPKMFHGATISPDELTALRSIKNMIRKGRITRLSKNEITLENGTEPTTPQTLHVDCTACAVANTEIVPVFQEDRIVPQTIRMVQPVFSASVVAYIEAHYETDERKNQLCSVVPLPNHDTDWIKVQAAAMMNQFNWSQEKELRRWIGTNRLDGYSKMISGVGEGDTEKLAVLNRMREAGMGAMSRLQTYIAELGATE